MIIENFDENLSNALHNRSRKFSGISKKSIEELRTKFFQHYSNCLNDFDPIDVDYVRNQDWFLFRYLGYCKNDVESALIAMVKSMKWRREKDYRNREYNYYPDITFKLGGAFFYEPDKNKCPTLYGRIKYVRKINEMKACTEDFSGFMLYKIDEQQKFNGYVLVLDFSGTGLLNANLDLARFGFNVLNQHFWGGLERILLINFPWILRAFWMIVKGWLSQDKVELIQMVDQESLKNFIPIENIPPFLGGTSERKYFGDELIPEGSISVKKWCSIHLGLDDNKMRSIYNIYQPLLLEQGFDIAYEDL